MGTRTILYYDCFSGISGDMNLGAMVDLGVDGEYLQEELKKLNLHGYRLNIYRASRKGIAGTKVDVVSDRHHDHRKLFDIQQIIEESSLNERVKRWSAEIFMKVAEAEAKVHGTSIDDIHFHEVGAVDSIVDIVGAAICRDTLNADSIQCSPVEVGGGFVDCSHGRLPVPAPATAEILTNVPIRSEGVSSELTTPTGAAIVATFAEEFTVKKDFTILKTAYGIGGRDHEIPNVLRVFMGEMDQNCLRDGYGKAVVIETNIDDMNPELYEHVIGRLLTDGAMDAYLTPIIMKKNRPAIQMTVLCGEHDIEKITDIIFRETTTLGIRRYSVERKKMNRSVVAVETPYGRVDVKIGVYNGEVIKLKPEYDQCRKLAEEHHIPLHRVYEIVQEAYRCRHRKENNI
ncbi:MAG TPA: nickel pincer cofactor biosynthesis protein LarC [Syntrophales bacterium]|nr:nickel pincer cofactor biosynthesis protein LarC [Syntrophales bacterium]HPQ44057.1 nickel pincer cofactor biosynthesis protein LarC [Syntrophales bacterium]